MSSVTSFIPLGSLAPMGCLKEIALFLSSSPSLDGGISSKDQRFPLGIYIYVYIYCKREVTLPCPKAPYG